MGDVPRQIMSVSDLPTVRPSSSSLTMLSCESPSDPEMAFCLWLNATAAPEGGEY